MLGREVSYVQSSVFQKPLAINLPFQVFTGQKSAKTHHLEGGFSCRGE